MIDIKYLSPITLNYPCPFCHCELQLSSDLFGEEIYCPTRCIYIGDGSIKCVQDDYMIYFNCRRPATVIIKFNKNTTRRQHLVSLNFILEADFYKETIEQIWQRIAPTVAVLR